MMTQGERPRPSVFSQGFGIAAILLTHAVALCCVMITMSKTVPTYAIFFEQQNVTPPFPTQWIVWMSEFCVVYHLPLFLFAMFTDAAILITLTFAAARKSWIRSAYSYGCLLAASVVLLYVGAWLSHPVSALVR